VIEIRGDGPLLRIGHRGAPALAPANTIAGFELALASGVDWIEFDVLERSDGGLVVAHDLSAVTDASPTLDDVLTFFVEHPRVGLHVDLKTDAHGAEVAAALRRHDLAARTFVSSHRWRALREIAAHAPGLTRGLTYPEDRFGMGKRKPLLPLVGAAVLTMRSVLPHRIERWLARAGASVAVLQHYFVSRAVIERCHALGVPVIVWTVDDPLRLRRLAALGVDAIVSNDPRIFAGEAPGYSARQ
jgi:glycerophosphoryl diester phosphodiesterase